MAAERNRVILGMGSHVPQKVLGNEELSKKSILLMNGFNLGRASLKGELPKSKSPPVT